MINANLGVYLATSHYTDKESLLVSKVIENINKMLRDVLQISIGLYTWRSFPPITYSQESKKNEIYGQVKSSDIFILIAANTLGTCENKLPIEIEAAKEKLEQDENFIFLSYFKSQNKKYKKRTNSDEVQALINEFNLSRQLYVEYEQTQYLEAILQYDLYRAIFRSLDIKGIRKTGKINCNDIFIVHGHDRELLEACARLTSDLSLNPLILHEQPNKGMTIIEKFERYSDVRGAIVLLTPDDVVSSSKTEIRRARQNVILELGFFMGKLGRNNVVCLYKSGTEIPSDYSGVLFIPYDVNGSWKLTLARELFHIGYLLNTDKLMGISKKG